MEQTNEATGQQIQESKSEVKPPKEPDKPKKELTEEQRQKQKKLIIYPLMVLIFGVVMWLIFAPSETEKEQELVGFNTDVPAPADSKMLEDKQTAYEQEMLDSKQSERQNQMRSLASMFDSGEEQTDEMPMLDEPEVKPKSGYGGGSERPRETIHASANAYRDMNRTLGNFYEQPKEDPEKEEMRKELEELRKMAYNRQTEKETADEQLALLEKSYQLAAKYMPQNQGQPFTGQPGTSPTVSTETKQPEAYRNGKAQMNPIGEVREQVISGLAQPMSDSVFIAEYSKERNMGFHTAVGKTGQTPKNTIRACVHDNQTIMDGQAVRLRLLEPMRTGETVIPKNALVTGSGKIAGERLGISITSLEYKGLIIPVELTVIDSDGQEGIFIPGSMEIDAIKEIAANLGGNLGTTINLNQQSAGDQLLTDLGKGAIQGTSQYIAKKMRTVKVHLKAGYKLMLYQKKQ